MAKVKVKNLNSFAKNFSNEQIKKISRAVYNARAQIEGEIVNTIFNGKSPVKGKSFQNYSARYSRIKGKKRPVDMFQTGDMLKSIDTRPVRVGGIRIFLKSSIAKFHDILGAGKSKVIRRLLPDASKGETFKPNIVKVIRKAISKGLK